MTVKIGLSVAPQHGAMRDMRNCWTKAEELGVDAIYSGDHFHAMVIDDGVCRRT